MHPATPAQASIRTVGRRPLRAGCRREPESTPARTAPAERNRPRSTRSAWKQRVVRVRELEVIAAFHGHAADRDPPAKGYTADRATAGPYRSDGGRFDGHRDGK